MRALEKQIASLKTRVAEEAARADDRVETIVSSEAKKLKDLNERHSRLRREHAALQAAVGRAGGGARGASDLETALTSERDDRFTAQLELVERNVRLEGRRAYEALERAKETQISQMREQSATFLADARAELAAARAEWEKEKKHNVKTNTALAEENDALRTWARSMNGVLRKIEEGAYPVVERGFWRSLRVPPAETRFSKTVPSEERTRAITLAATNTSTFLETMEDDAMATSGTAEFRVENSETRGGGGDAFGNSQTVSGAVPVAFGVSTTRPVDPYDTVAYDRSDRNARAGETFELEAFRKHGDLVEEERAATQEATLRELSSHPTVEYIRALEEENAKVKGDLSRERRSASDARVALQSARRQQDKLITKETLRRQNRASSARPAERVTQSAFGATVPKQTFVGPPMSPESFRATLNPNNGGTHVIRTYAGLTQTNDASRRPNKGLTSPEVAERVRVTTLSRDAARRAEARRARGGGDRRRESLARDARRLGGVSGGNARRGLGGRGAARRHRNGGCRRCHRRRRSRARLTRRRKAIGRFRVRPFRLRRRVVLPLRPLGTRRLGRRLGGGSAIRGVEFRGDAVRARSLLMPPQRRERLAHAYPCLGPLRLDAHGAARVLQRAARVLAERENGSGAVGVGFGVPGRGGERLAVRGDRGA